MDERTIMGPHASSRPAIPRRIEVAMGALLLAQFTLTAFIKIHRGIHEEIWWMSHVALLLAAVGLLIGSRRFVMAALIAVLLPHGLWLVDAIIGLAGGAYPLRIASYLAHADALVWASTSHHFYLVPLLVVLALRGGSVPCGALPFACTLIIVLTLVGRFALPRHANVNWAHWILPLVNWPAVRWFDALPAPLYLLALNLGTMLMFYVPSWCVLRMLVGSGRHPSRIAA